MFFGLFGGEKNRTADMNAVARVSDSAKVKKLVLAGVSINIAESESGPTDELVVASTAKA